MASSFVDLELGSASVEPSDMSNMPQKNIREDMSNFTSSMVEKDSNDTRRNELSQIEDRSPGYPRYSALIGSEKSFYICRRFLILRARLLLQKQDKLSLLENQLEDIDRKEPVSLFLGSNRRDRNEERQQVLSDIDTTLADYDAFVKRSQEMLEHSAARSRDISSLQHWVEGTSSLARDETAYLERGNDLMSVASVEDDALSRLEALLEHTLVKYLKRYRKNSKLNISKDPNVYISSGTALNRAARSLIAWLVVVLLLVPVIIINAIDSVVVRMGVIVATSALVIITLSFLTKAKTGEVFVAGATYATVLVVFVAGTSTTPG